MSDQGKINLGNLKKDAIELADMTGSPFAVPAHVHHWVNLELSKLHEQIALAWADRIVKFPVPTISIVSGKDAYMLPDDFGRVLMVYEHSGSDRLPVDKFRLDHIHNSNIPGAAKTVDLWHIPAFVPLLDDNDEVNWSTDWRLPWGWHEAVTAGVAIKLLSKEESDTSVMQGIKNEALGLLDIAAPEFNADEPDRIGDTRDRWRDPDFYMVASGGATLRYALAGNRIYFREF